MTPEYNLNFEHILLLNIFLKIIIIIALTFLGVLRPCQNLQTSLLQPEHHG